MFTKDYQVIQRKISPSRQDTSCVSFCESSDQFAGVFFHLELEKLASNSGEPTDRHEFLLEFLSFIFAVFQLQGISYSQWLGLGAVFLVFRRTYSINLWYIILNT